MKKTIDVILLVVLALVVGLIMYLSDTNKREHSAEINDAYAAIENHVKTEKGNNEYIAVLLDELENQRKVTGSIQNHYDIIVTELKKKLSEYPTASSFLNVEACRKKYELLFTDYEKCVFSHNKAKNIISRKESEIKKTNQAMALMEENFQSCLESRNQYERIIRAYKKKSRWGFFVGPVVGWGWSRPLVGFAVGWGLKI